MDTEGGFLGGVDPGDVPLVGVWRRALRGPAREALEGVYAEVAARVAARGPACWASGRCCNFERAGHRLYVTGLEAVYTVDRAATGALTPVSLAAALARGGCPFQTGTLCGEHARRPLGCRVYFCDRTAQEWQQELSEEMLGRIRAIHDAHGIAYRYGEWRGMLGLVLAASRATT